MKDQALLSKILGKAPWSVWKGIGSFLLFEFGPRRVAQNGRPQGTFTLWIYMAHWRVRRHGKEIAHSESSDKAINGVAKKLEGLQLRALVIQKVIMKGCVRHGARFCFDNDYTLQASMYDNHEPDAIFMLYSPTHMLELDYDGQLVTKKLKRSGTRHSSGRQARTAVPNGTSVAGRR